MWIRKKEHKDRVMDGTKANEGKTIPISDLANKAVKKWLIKSGVRSGHLFIRGENVPSYRSIEYRCTQALKRAGIPFTATHVLRHGSLSEFYEQTKDLMATKAMAGHTSLKSTERYVGVRRERLHEQAAQVSKALSSIEI